MLTLSVSRGKDRDLGFRNWDFGIKANQRINKQSLYT